MTSPNRNVHEVWSLDDGGEPRLHGTALGLTFEDACKQLSTESVDFWTHYDRGHYRGRPLHPSREDALEGHDRRRQRSSG